VSKKRKKIQYLSMESFFGELGVLAESKDGARIQCHICGKMFKALGTHLRKSHGMTAHEYRGQFGLNRGTSLSSAVSRELTRSSCTLGEKFPGGISNYRDIPTVKPIRLQGRNSLSKAQLSPHTQAKKRETMKTFKHTHETRKKMSESAKRIWSERKKAAASAKATAQPLT